MAVVAVLLNNKLYVANVGEPPVPGQGGLGEKPSSGSVRSWAVCSPNAWALQPEFRGPWVGFLLLCRSVSVPVGEVEVPGWDAGSPALVPMLPLTGLWPLGSCVPVLVTSVASSSGRGCQLWKTHLASHGGQCGGLDVGRRVRVTGTSCGICGQR